MNAFLEKVKHIHTIEEAESLLWEYVPTPKPGTKKALELSVKAHEGQFRKSGEPYIVHPILVAAVTAAFSNDETMVQAALLHDVVEDTNYGIEDLASMFSDDVTHLVEGLTKIVQIRDEKLVSSASDERLINSALSFRKMLIASIKDIRVLVIKLCDRLHNMLTLDALPPQKQKRIAEETLVVYAPIAHRLGIARMKNQLEDLSFYYIYPDDYKHIDDYVKSNTQNLQLKLNAFIQKVTEMMLKDGFEEGDFEIFGRMKHYYSTYLKMHRKGVSIEEVLDLLAIRIIVKKPIACYQVLGLLHLGYTPLISRFKDYIAVPKENGYQTIHTTLFDEEGIVEAQIRTEEMHKLAEYGVAAHWKYKSGGEGINLEWLEGLSYANESIEEFYELAKCDLFSEDITVFSPKGDYYTLPKGSVALDFAYLIHSEVGANAVSAMINKREVPLLTVLKNGDIVNIVKEDIPHLHCTWLDTVKTSRAQEGIRSLCRARIKEANMLSAYNILGNLFDQPSRQMKELIEEIGLQDTIHKLPLQIDYNKETIRQVADFLGKKELRFWELRRKGYKKPVLKEIEHLKFFTNKTIEGVEFDYCCHPKVGDQIVAFYKENKAVVHHKLCKKAYALMKEGAPDAACKLVKIKVVTLSFDTEFAKSKGVLAELLQKLTKLDLNVISIELGIQSSDTAEYCQIEVESDQSNKAILAEKISQHFKLIEIISLDDAYNK